MGAELLEDAELRELCDRCSDAALVDLRRLLTSAGEDELRRTENAQPALTFTGIALARLLARRGVEPAAAAGHSVGEYAALCVAGAVGAEDALRAVGERGRAMAEAAPAGTTTMAAVLGLGAAQVEAVLQGMDAVWAANYNTPTQTVIAGSTDGVELASERLREAGARRVVPLNVSAAFHTPLVSQAASRLRRVLDEIPWRRPLIPVLANLTAARYEAPEDIPGMLERQLSSPVRWSDSVAALADLGIGTYVELGPKRALTGMLRELAPGAAARNVATPDDAETLQ
jgi:[acyl-carrier-protein] S-malonyltransferase